MRKLLRKYWMWRLRKAELAVMIYAEKLSWKSEAERMKTAVTLDLLSKMPPLSQVGQVRMPEVKHGE